MSTRYYSNSASQAALASAIGATDTAIAFTSGSFTGYPTQYPYTAAIARGTADEEIVLVTAASGDTATVTRAFDGTTGKAHGAGATFTEVVVALDYREANDHVNATSAVHGTVGAVVGDTDAQTLSNKTLTAPTVTGGTFTGTQTIAQANVTTLTVTGVTTLANAAISGTASVGGTFAVTGLLTASGGLTVPAGHATTVDTLTAGATSVSTLAASGLASLNGGATVPTGKKITITDAAAADTDAANAGYVKGLFATPPTGRKLALAQGTGTAFPTVGLVAGDTFLRTDVGTNGTLFVYTGSSSIGSAGWLAEGPVICTSSTRPTAALYAGLETFETDTKLPWHWDGAAWAPVGPGQWVIPTGALGGTTYNWTIPTAMTTAPGMSGTVTVPTGRQLEVEFRAPKLTLAASADVRVQLVINGAAYDYQEFSLGANMSAYMPVALHAAVDSLSGSIAFSAQAQSVAATNTLQGIGASGPLLRYRIS